MTHPQSQVNSLDEIVNLISTKGTAGLAESVRLLLNLAMKIERSEALGAAPHERTAERKGYANGFKNKTLKTRLGEITVDVPQVRGEVDFYPSALERGRRSERALTLAIAEMYVQGVSTRRVGPILSQLAGTLEISSMQVSRAAAQLDEQLEIWRNRSLSSLAHPYLILDARYEKVRRDGTVLDCAVLCAIGVDASGTRTILGVSTALSEAHVHWGAVNRRVAECLVKCGAFDGFGDRGALLGQLEGSIAAAQRRIDLEAAFGGIGTDQREALERANGLVALQLAA